MRKILVNGIIMFIGFVLLVTFYLHKDLDFLFWSACVLLGMSSYYIAKAIG